MPISTKLTRALGIKHPLIQGGMHYVGYAPLVAAVGNAGGIGCITALTQPSPEALRAEIRLCKELSSKPFGMNLTLLPTLAPPDCPAYADVVEDEMKSGQLRELGGIQTFNLIYGWNYGVGIMPCLTGALFSSCCT